MDLVVGGGIAVKMLNYQGAVTSSVVLSVEIEGLIKTMTYTKI